MIKNILLNYVMGKYRNYILIFLAIICILCIIIDIFFISKSLDIERIMLTLLGYIIFFFVINNASMPGFPVIDKDSDMFFIFMRIFQLIIVFGLLIRLLYEMVLLN